MGKTFQQIYIHAIWSTKNRQPLITKNIRFKLCVHIKKDATEKGVFIDTINAVEDHMHCLISLNTTQSVADAIHQIKGESSHWLNENFKMSSDFIWQTGYAAISVSPKDLKMIRNYIKNQDYHHKQVSFENELKFFGINPNNFFD